MSMYELKQGYVTYIGEREVVMTISHVRDGWVAVNYMAGSFMIRKDWTQVGWGEEAFEARLLTNNRNQARIMVRELASIEAA